MPDAAEEDIFWKPVGAVQGMLGMWECGSGIAMTRVSPAKIGVAFGGLWNRRGGGHRNVNPIREKEKAQ